MGFSKPKHQGAAKYNTALKALVKAKKEHASLEVKKESSQHRTQLIMSGTLHLAMIANKARISNKRIVITCEFCSQVQASCRQYIKHRKQMHPDQLWFCKVCSRGYKSYNGCYKHEKAMKLSNYFVLSAARDLTTKKIFNCTFQFTLSN